MDTVMLKTHALTDTCYAIRCYRYMNRGSHDGAPRYRNPNNIYIFRHSLRRSEELGITRHACLPEHELVGEDTESAISAAALSLGREISGKAGMNFSRLVKTSLQGINLDRKASKKFERQEKTPRCLIRVWFGSDKRGVGAALEPSSRLPESGPTKRGRVWVAST